MRLSLLSTLSLAAALVEGYEVAPPGPVLPNTISDCSGWVLPTASDTCAILAPQNGITVAQFITYNPFIGSACILTVGFAYCIQENGGKPPVTTTLITTTSPKPPPKTTTTAPTTTAPGNGIATPTPIQPGMVSNCNAFYLVQAGDQCGTIATAKGISLDNFYAWNPSVGSACASLWSKYYVCVGTVGSTPNPPTPTSAKGNGIATPTPFQAGMASDCDSFYLVQAGDQCGTIATAKGITLADFYAWNPAVGTSCASLWAADYVCVGIIGGRPAPPTPTSHGNGIATPTPVQPGMTTRCKNFHLVVGGDQCGNIATAARISLSDFYAWNPTVGSSCASLWLGYYVCIGV